MRQTGNFHFALLLAMKSLNLKKKHEVINPGMSYISTGLSVVLNNNKIVFADIDENTGLVSLENIKKKISIISEKLGLIKYADFDSNINLNI